jgi:hypothetical protein
VAQLLADADRLFTEAEEALQQGGSSGFAEYQEKLAQAKARMDEALALILAAVNGEPEPAPPQGEATDTESTPA